MSLLFAAAIVLIVYLAERYMQEHALDGLHFDTGTKKRTAECGEVFQIFSAVENRKRIPVLFLKIAEHLPPEAEVISGGGGLSVRKQNIFGQEGRTTAERLTYIMPHQKASWTTDVSLPKRGRYILRGADLSAGDFLGIRERTMQVPLAKEMIIIPEKAKLDSFEEAFGGYLGELSVRRFIMPDPIDTVGFREYTGYEPQRDISWKETLRRGRLMVRQYDYTAEKRAVVAADTEGASPEQAEKIFSIARSVCEILEEKNMTFSFLTDAWIISPENIHGYVPEGTGRTHLQAILEILGRAGYDLSSSPQKLMEEAFEGRYDGRSCIYICASSAAKADLIRYREGKGQKIFVIEAGDAI